ncbi:MAG: anaerobic ribonucleoside-triphosphate reductase activating protein [Clostridiales bacterium]|nr:anaerobic ribonucleoside-triphosphate reductase activating protein [Clostridiales bacterium]
MKGTVRIAGIIEESIVDGPGIRMVIFAQGCPHRCKGCHNPETHDFEGGYLMSLEDIVQLPSRNPLLDGVTFSGGEPFSQAKAFSMLGRRFKDLGLDIMTYTGYTYEFLLEKSKETSAWKQLLDVTDVLVDGKFEIEKKNLLLPFRGSENQRIIDLKETRRQNKIVILDI